MRVLERTIRTVTQAIRIEGSLRGPLTLKSVAGHLPVKFSLSVLTT